MKNKKGFTLIELLVSISIIAILTVTISISFSKAQKNGRDVRRKEDMKMVQNAAEQYYLLNNGDYPTTTSGSWTGSDGQMILQSFPKDPKTKADYTYRTVSVSGYCFCANIEGGSGNSNVSDCSNSSKTSGDLFCVNNQQ